MRALTVVAVLGFCVAALAQEAATADGRDAAQSRTVTVTAQGYDRDDALKQALRAALEQGAGVQIASYSEVANYALARDTIYSRAAGIVSDYRIIKGPQEVAGGMWEVTIEAVVRASAVAETWGEVQNLLDRLGRPRIMVWIDEKIDGEQQQQSVVESRIEELFVKAGFDLVAREAVKDIRSRAAAEAESEHDAEKLVRLARQADAHILIRGYAHANRAGLEDLYGAPAAFYNCDVQAKVYSTSTGKLIASESIPLTRRGARSRREFSPQAARSALVAATFPHSDTRREPALATRLFESVMERWSTELSSAGDIELEVEGLDFKTFVRLRKALGELERIRSVDGDFSDGTGKYRIKAQVSARTLAELLLEKPFDEWLEVTDLKPERIQAKALNR
jgi:hypothetical protein